VAGLAAAIELALKLDEDERRPPGRAHGGRGGASRRLLADRAGIRDRREARAAA
jgi:hypothetical protein